MNVGSLFSGIGLLDYGLTLAGWEHGFLCESEPDRRAILSMRWPGVPIFEDVRDVDGSAPRVDLLAFGFPCKGGSTAGKRTGLDHPETALWREGARVIGELRPRLVLVENVANLLAVRRGGAWGEVVGDLAALGYVFAWDCLPAAAFGAPHLRDRVFLVACDADGERRQGGRQPEHSEPTRTRFVADDIATPHPDKPRTDAHPSPSGSRSPARERDRAPADPQRNGVWEQPVAERGGEGPRVAAEAGQDAADAARICERRPGPSSGPEWERTRPLVDTVSWGDYAPAIHRWEEIHGPAPEPLVRGVDDRGSRRVVRSRLSALGDGVQVQAGEYLGARLMELA